jgi:hypothetical protein
MALQIKEKLTWRDHIKQATIAVGIATGVISASLIGAVLVSLYLTWVNG